MWYNHRTSSNGNGLRYRTGWNDDKRTWATILDNVNYSSILDGRYVNAAGDTMTGVLTAPNVPSKILDAIINTGAGTAYYDVTDSSDTVTLAAGKIIIVSPNTTPSNGSAVYINYNGTGYKAAYDSRNGSLTYFRFRAGWRACFMYDGTYWRALYTPDTQWPLSLSKTTAATNYYLLGNSSTASSVSTNTCYTTNSIYMTPSEGSITATKFNGTASAANQLNLTRSISGTSHANALQTEFTNNKASISRNCLKTYYSSAYSNGSFYMGYFLSGYDSNPYGGFFVAHYNTPYYVGISNGSFSERQIWTRGDAVTSAVWNDYAECRKSDSQEPGYVMFEKGDDSLSKTIERLQHFAGIVSDTWGFSQGETADAKTNIAVAGRVLAYPYRDRNEYKPGDCVCAAPGGKVDIMTREEIVQYPDRIVGTVSCVPEYEEWGGGESADRSPVKINGRIWIKVK